MNQQKSFLSLGGGAMLERFDYELQRAIANIQDPNTPANKPRKVTLTVTLKPDADRKQITHEVVVKSSLQPTNPLMGSTALIPDGGAWKIDAKHNISDYFRENLSDLVESGQVVIAE